MIETDRAGQGAWTPADAPAAPPPEAGAAAAAQAGRTAPVAPPRRLDLLRASGVERVDEIRLRDDRRAQVWLASCGPGRSVVPATADLSLALLVGGAGTVRGDLGAGRFRAACRPGMIACTPADAAIEYELSEAQRLVFLAVPWAEMTPALAEAADGADLDLGPLHAGVHRDAALEALLRRLWAEAAAGSPAGPLYADAALGAVGRRLVRVARGGPAPPAREVPPLHGARLRRVLDRVEAGLADADLRLDALASEAGLSGWHFLRAFKAATGLPPHRWVLLKRVAAAQAAMLAEPGLPLAQVAAACGFADQSHLAASFRRMVGDTPAAWRRAHRAGAEHATAQFSTRSRPPRGVD